MPQNKQNKAEKYACQSILQWLRIVQVMANTPEDKCTKGHVTALRINPSAL